MFGFAPNKVDVRFSLELVEPFGGNGSDSTKPIRQEVGKRILLILQNCTKKGLNQTDGKYAWLLANIFAPYSIEKEFCTLNIKFNISILNKKIRIEKGKYPFVVKIKERLLSYDHHKKI